MFFYFRVKKLAFLSKYHHLIENIELVIRYHQTSCFLGDGRSELVLIFSINKQKHKDTNRI